MSVIYPGPGDSFPAGQTCWRCGKWVPFGLGHACGWSIPAPRPTPVPRVPMPMPTPAPTQSELEAAYARGYRAGFKDGREADTPEETP